MRYRCWDAYEWLNLAEYLHGAGRHDDALWVLAELYDQDPNWFEQLLQNEREFFLSDLVDRPEYEHSELRTLRKKERRKGQKRRKRFREALRELPEGHRPSETYVARDVCPIECCIYRTWSVHDRVPLYEAPRGDTKVAILENGDTVVGRTGNVYRSPRPVGVVHEVTLEDGTKVSVGEILYELDYMGEGYSHVYYQGEVHRAFTYELRSYCPRPDTDCWGEYLDSQESKQVWWVEVEAPSGVTGWTDRIGAFSGMGSCG